VPVPSLEFAVSRFYALVETPKTLCEILRWECACAIVVLLDF
jgi:hypothetical protein